MGMLHVCGFSLHMIRETFVGPDGMDELLGMLLRNLGPVWHSAPQRYNEVPL
uniref:Uncharacterized protein n=1 Tax=Oryza brachyantha TaxID=4533 RepID=J3L2L7_ORYBR